MKKKKQVFLLLCDKTTDSLIELYKTIHSAADEIGDTFILYHQKDKSIPNRMKQLKYFAFTDSIITQGNYLPIGFNLIPGNNHFPLLQFYISNPMYDYYWCIEEDVRFSGNWTYFFKTISSMSQDFISSHIRTSLEEPHWPWWHTLAHPYTFISFENRLRSFNPIYRITNRALAFIHQALLIHWCGHHEVLLPTLLHKERFKIADFGGSGKFVLPKFKNKFYIDSTSNEQGILNDGTMRWRPTFPAIGSLKNKLYHPIKS